MTTGSRHYRAKQQINETVKDVELTPVEKLTRDKAIQEYWDRLKQIERYLWG